MVRQAAKAYKHSELEESVRKRWAETDSYRLSKEMRQKKGMDYFFIDGPPYTTGYIHIGIALNKSLKDAYIRYLRMRGYNVRDQPGFDMHGLPIEVMVEKSLKIKNKREIEQFGIDRFVNACRDYAVDFKNKMVDEFKSLGVWMDWENPYLTITPQYIEAAWWTVKKAWDKGLLKEDYSVLQWCPRCQTVLAEAEIEYWDEVDPSIYVMFPVKGEKDTFLLIWTTTPWTLPANIAVAAHPEYTYAHVSVTKGERDFTLIMLRDKVEEFMGLFQPETYGIIKTVPGQSLEGLGYEPPLLAEVTLQRTLKGDWVHRVVLSKIVALENSGLVHIAPGHGREDFDIGTEYKLPVISPIDEVGVFSEEAGSFKGMFIKEADPIIISALTNKGLMAHSDKLVHRYGHCWRCKSPIIFRPTQQWFLRVTALKDRMMEELDRIKWTPEWVGSGRMREWVTNARDWCMSRQRYWGIPMPVWRCSCGAMEVVSSAAELAEKGDYKPGTDLHRPWIDSVALKCPKCGGKMARVPDVIDVWFDSGVCAWAQLGYPANEEEFKRWFPCKWITEAYEQTRGWYYSQLSAGVITMDRSPYDSVLSHGLIVDEKGQKMSKSSGNAMKPREVIEKFGADSLRFYLLKSGPVWEDLLFSADGVKNTNRTLNVLWNVYSFATTYMAIDRYDPKRITHDEISNALKPEDKWLLSELETLKRNVTRHMEDYNIHKAAREIEHFILEALSRWYVKIIRDRVWAEGDTRDKSAAYYALHQSLVSLSQLMAPLTPYISEEIYGNLEGWQPTVNMCEWPVANEALIDAALEQNMLILRKAVEATTGARQQGGIKLRWPLRRAVVVASNDETVQALTALRPLFLAQTNVKNLRIFKPGEEWDELDLEVLPNSEAIGQQYRQWATKIGAMLRMQPPKEVKKGIEKGEFSLGIEGQLIRIFPNMISFAHKAPKTMKSMEFDGGRIYIDIEITPELRAEANAREIVRRIQEMRKEMDLNVEEYVETTILCDEKLKKHLSGHIDFISKETRSHKLQFRDVPTGECIVEWGIGEHTVTIGLTALHLREGVRAIMALDVLGMREDIAKAMFFAGLSDPMRIERATPEELQKVRGMSRDLAERIREAARKVNSPQAQGAPAPQAPADLAPAPSQQAHPLQAFVTHPPPQQAAPEAPKPQEKIDLQISYIYLQKGVSSDIAYEHFKDAIAKGSAGICITRSFPDKIRERYQLGDIQLVWLTNAPKDNAMKPKDLEKLSLSIDHFLEGKPDGSVILLDCIEYLITNNNFGVVLRFIQTLRDMVAIKKAVLLITLNPATIEPQQVTLLEREVDQIM